MSKAFAHRTLMVSALAVIAAGCGDAGESGSDWDAPSIEQPITGVSGTVNLVTANQNQSAPYHSVIRFAGFSNGPCTATKIRNDTRDRFLTAGHCLDQGPERLSIYSSVDGSSSVGRDIRAIFRHPSCRTDGSAGTNCAQATSTSYDVAIFEVDNIPSVAVATLDTPYVQPGLDSRIIGYGCNVLIPQWEGLKQQALDTAESRGTDSAAKYARYIKSAGPPTVCEGDSGGPLVSTFSPFRIRGVTSHFTADQPINGPSYFARISNIRRWIASPHKLNVITNLEMGFLQNKDGKKCAAIDGSGNTTLFECDGRSQPEDDQYWQLLATDGHFRIMNTLHDTCLSVSGSTVTAVGCSSADTKQHWTFSQVQLALPGVSYLQIRNRFSGQYLTRANPETPLRTAAFSLADPKQRWFFYP